MTPRLNKKVHFTILNGQLLIITRAHKPGADSGVSELLDSVKLSCPLVLASCNALDTLMGQNLLPETLRQVIISN